MTHGGLRDAARIAIGAPRLWALALAGFLARGGIVLFALPILVLPSVVGIVTFIGPNAVTSAGFSGRFVSLAIASATVIGAGLLLGIVVSVLAELALIEAVLRESRPVTSPVTSGRLVGRLLVIRTVSLVPFGVSFAVAGARLIDVGYQEIILPSDVATALPERILRSTPEAIAVLALGWLLTELVGAVAARLAVIGGRSAGGSLVGAVGWMVRRPVRTLWTTLATVVGSLLVAGPLLFAAGAAWRLVRDVLLGSWEPAAAIVVVLLFVGVWVLALVVAGIAAAWRSAAWSLAVARDHRGAGVPPSDGGTL